MSSIRQRTSCVMHPCHAVAGYPTNVTLASASPSPLRHRSYSSLDFSVFNVLRGELLLFYLRVFQGGDTLEGECLWRPWAPASAR